MITDGVDTRQGVEMSSCSDGPRSAWFDAQVEKESKKDVLPRQERNGQPLVIAGTVVVIMFVAAHQLIPTGFFTDGFGALASFLMYGMLMLGAIPAIVRFQTGRRNPGRLVESGGLVFSIVAEVYFLVKFPFDFSHFADPLPNALEFLIDWVSGTLAKILLTFAIVVSVIMCIYGLVMYFAVRERLATVTGATEPPEVPEVEGPEETSEAE